ncbi:MAG: hypothetical protein ACE5NM_06935 [Sedimentisphaerales bacterium]
MWERKMANFVVSVYQRTTAGFMSVVAYVLASVFLTVVQPCFSFAEVIFQTSTLRLEIADNGILQSLTAKPSGTEYSWLVKPGPIAKVYRGGKTFDTTGIEFEAHRGYFEDRAPAYHGGQSFSASSVKSTGGKMTVQFGKANVTATYEVIKTSHYLAFKLLKLAGGPINRIDLLMLRIRKLPYLGTWIDVAYDDHFGICLCAGNIKTYAGMNQHTDYVELRAIAEKNVAFVGTTAVLFGCRDPKNNFLEVMEDVEHDFNMPAGASRRRSPIQKYSYLWALRPTADNVDQYIELAKRCGLRMILFSYKAFTKGAGHFVWNSQYPHGMADLKKVTDAIRSAGLKLGLHIHYSKAHKTDPYVTPVPDDRFHKVRTFAFARDVDSKAKVIAVNENPKGCILDDGRRILKAGKELIAYTNFTTEPPYQFIGCERGHLKTTATAHKAGEKLELLDVDDWHVFIRFDQNTDIQDEVAQRIGEIFNQTGPYDMVYFDGAEDVHAPFWYNVANAQYRVFRQFKTEPAVCEAAMNSHFGWHMMSRSNAYDVSSQHVKNFCYHVSCRTAPVRALDFTRIEFGWIFGLYDYMGPDVLEYVLSRGAAWDCPFSIRTTPEQVAAHPRKEDCLDVIKLWEDARINNKLTDVQRQKLRTVDPNQHQFVKIWEVVKTKPWIDLWSKTEFTDQQHHLFINEHGEHELVAIDEIPNVANGFFKAYSFRRRTQPDDCYVLIWAVAGEAELLLPITANRLTVMRPFGTGVTAKTKDGKAVVPVSSRRYLVFSNMSVEQVRQILHKANKL